MSLLRLTLARHGVKLILDAPHGAILEDFPQIRVYAASVSGGSAPTMTLRIGRDVHIGQRLTLELEAAGDSSLEVHDGASILNNVRILLRSGQVSLGPRTQVRDSAWLKSDGVFSTGEEVLIGPMVAIHCTERIEIGDRVGTGERISILDSEHEFDETEAFYMKLPVSTAPVTIGEQTMVGLGTVVLPGVAIGSNCVVGANSLVRGGSYPDGSLIAGNPARRIKGLGSDPDS